MDISCILRDRYLFSSQCDTLADANIHGAQSAAAFRCPDGITQVGFIHYFDSRLLSPL